MSIRATKLIQMKRSRPNTYCLHFFVETTNECQSKNLCHTEATCRDVDNGYMCTCNRGYVGNGTYCVGKYC